jgi:hypothetical protein
VVTFLTIPTITKGGKMRKVVYGVAFFIVLSSSSAFAQWDKWQPWVTEIGVTPYTELNYRNADSSMLGSCELQKTGLDLIVGIQVVLPPLYMRYGFSNMFNMFMTNDDTTFCPLFADWRIGAQVTYEDITTYDLSVSFIKSFAEYDFMALVVEIGYGRIVADLAYGGIQVLGNIGVGTLMEAVPPDSLDLKSNEPVFDLGLGVFWRTPIVSPYLCGGVGYPFAREEAELNVFYGGGLQVQFPNAYTYPSPDIPYPKIFRIPGS